MHCDWASVGGEPLDERVHHRPHNREFMYKLMCACLYFYLIVAKDELSLTLFVFVAGRVHWNYYSTYHWRKKFTSFSFQ